VRDDFIHGEDGLPDRHQAQLIFDWETKCLRVFRVIKLLIALTLIAI
jgi:hypothetical protein